MRLEAVQTIEAMGALHAPTAHSHCLIYGAALSVSAPQDSDAATRKALVDFSYHMALGNMDEAFRAVRSIWAFGAECLHNHVTMEFECLRCKL